MFSLFLLNLLTSGPKFQSQPQEAPRSPSSSDSMDNCIKTSPSQRLQDSWGVICRPYLTPSWSGQRLWPSWQSPFGQLSLFCRPSCTYTHSVASLRLRNLAGQEPQPAPQLLHRPEMETEAQAGEELAQDLKTIAETQLMYNYQQRLRFTNRDTKAQRGK